MKLRKNIYIFSYMISIMIMSVLNILSVTDVLDKRLNLKLTANPILFLILDGIILGILMHNLKKEPYKVKERVISYFKTVNNLYLFIALLISTSFLSIPVNMISNLVLVYFLRPLIPDSDGENGVEEYFKKYPEKAHHKFYKNIEEIKDDYKPLKEEVEIEIPALDAEVKTQNKDKRRKFIYTILPILIITIVVIGVLFSIVETVKSFKRAQYNYFEIIVNEEKMNIYYNEDYHRVIIPIIYEQTESNSFFSNQEKLTIDNYLQKTDKYIIELKEYECINDKKDRVSCGTEALVEKRKETESTSSNMEIYLGNKEIYKGQFQNDITNYINENGTYKITITNKKEYIETKIGFNLSINELGIDD